MIAPQALLPLITGLGIAKRRMDAKAQTEIDAKNEALRQAGIKQFQTNVQALVAGRHPLPLEPSYTLDPSIVPPPIAHIPIAEQKRQTFERKKAVVERQRARAYQRGISYSVNPKGEVSQRFVLKDTTPEQLRGTFLQELQQNDPERFAEIMEIASGEGVARWEVITSELTGKATLHTFDSLGRSKGTHDLGVIKTPESSRVATTHTWTDKATGKTFRNNYDVQGHLIGTSEEIGKTALTPEEEIEQIQKATIAKGQAEEELLVDFETARNDRIFTAIGNKANAEFEGNWGKKDIGDGMVNAIVGGAAVVDLMANIMSLLGTALKSGKKDLTGPLNPFRTRLEQLGIIYDHDRIQLRSMLAQTIKIMYDIGGKQLSDKEFAKFKPFVDARANYDEKFLLSMVYEMNRSAKVALKFRLNGLEALGKNERFIKAMRRQAGLDDVVLVNEQRLHPDGIVRTYKGGGVWEPSLKKK